MDYLQQLSTQFIQGLPDAAAMINCSQQIITYNKAFVRLSGLRENMFLKRIAAGETIFDLFKTESGLDRQSF
jgi:PAS domain-containing protein